MICRYNPMMTARLKTLLMLLFGATFLTFGAQAQNEGLMTTAAVDSASVATDVDSASVETAGKAIGVAIGFITGEEVTLSDAETSLAGASAQDTGAYWIVTVTRINLDVLDAPRLIAVSKIDGEARDLLRGDADDHPEHGKHRPRTFR
jgi:hypothetical protein